MKNIIRDIFIYLFLCVASFGMLLTVSQYVRFDDHAGFLQFKQDYLEIKIWKLAFYTHVFSAIIALFAGFTQFSSFVLKKHRPLHKLFGRIYAFNILFINFPAAMIMAFYANGNLSSRIAFFILDILWFWFTYKAVTAAKQKDFKAHREFMIRSYALTLSAIALRMWKIVLVNSTGLDVATIYMIDAWLGFVPNLLFAEWLIRRRKANLLSTGKNKIIDYKKISEKN